MQDVILGTKIMKSFWPKQPLRKLPKDNSTVIWAAPITYPSVTDDTQDP